MTLLLGLWIFSVALTFFITFLLGDSLTTKEKIKLALGIIAFISLVFIGAYLIEPYIK